MDDIPKAPRPAKTKRPRILKDAYSSEGLSLAHNPGKLPTRVTEGDSSERGSRPNHKTTGGATMGSQLISLHPPSFRPSQQVPAVLSPHSTSPRQGTEPTPSQSVGASVNDGHSTPVIQAAPLPLDHTSSHSPDLDDHSLAAKPKDHKSRPKVAKPASTANRTSSRNPHTPSLPTQFVNWDVFSEQAASEAPTNTSEQSSIEADTKNSPTQNRNHGEELAAVDQRHSREPLSSDSSNLPSIKIGNQTRPRPLNGTNSPEKRVQVLDFPGSPSRRDSGFNKAQPQGLPPHKGPKSAQPKERHQAPEAATAADNSSRQPPKRPFLDLGPEEQDDSADVIISRSKLRSKQAGIFARRIKRPHEYLLQPDPRSANRQKLSDQEEDVVYLTQRILRDPTVEVPDEMPYDETNYPMRRGSEQAQHHLDQGPSGISISPNAAGIRSDGMRPDIPPRTYHNLGNMISAITHTVLRRLQSKEASLGDVVTDFEALESNMLETVHLHTREREKIHAVVEQQWRHLVGVFEEAGKGVKGMKEQVIAMDLDSMTQQNADRTRETIQVIEELDMEFDA